MASPVFRSIAELPERRARAGTGPRSLRQIRRAVLAWYATAHRDFPWRHTVDPYAVLVSEVMLQQTQASRVAERFPRFLERFPTAAALAAAPDAEVLAAWSGLGYNRRAILLKRTAARVSDAGPRAVPELERLPGVGPYTARAIASIAFGDPVGVVDTNVRRWLVRRFGLDPGGADGAPGRLQALADGLARARPDGAANRDEVAAWTHATMELGGAICTPRRPACDACPIAAGCPSRGRAGDVPVPRQAPFAGSSRAWRGAILRLISSSPRHELTRDDLERALLAGSDRPRDGADERFASVAAALAGLERDGLVHRRGRRVRLGAGEASSPREAGAAEPPEAAATIGP